MDILLVNASPKIMTVHARLTPPLGLAYIASVLINAGYDVSAIDFNVSSLNLLEKLLEKEPPRILGISTHTETYLNGLKIAETAKQVNPGINVVMGGTHPTVMYQEVARERNIDVVARGEGEYTMLELANYFIRNEGGLSEIKGIAYQDNGAVKVAPERPFIEDPDELPFPARGLFPLSLYGSPGTALISRGGCPFNCHYCAVNNIWKGRRRFRKPEKIVEEITYIIRNGQAQWINFADDIFTLDRRRVVELCSLLKGLKLRWLCTTRVDLVDEELLSEMYEAGCYSVTYGVESGSQKILDAIGKKITLEQVRRAVKTTIDIGMKVTCFFMFPQPDDTEETIREQIQFMKELKRMRARLVLSFTTPYPGTYYYEHARELGIKTLVDSWDEYQGRRLTITTKYLSEEKLNSLVEELVRDVGLEISK